MKVLIVEPGRYPREAKISSDLESMQGIVGGLMQAVYPWEDRAALVCNDEGKLMGLPLNRSLEDYDIIAGTLFICGLGRDDFAGLTQEQMAHYAKKFWLPELFFKTPNGLTVKPCEPAVYRLFMGEPARQRKGDERGR